jgi:hypothetical protein
LVGTNLDEATIIYVMLPTYPYLVAMCSSCGPAHFGVIRIPSRLEIEWCAGIVVRWYRGALVSWSTDGMSPPHAWSWGDVN